MSPLIDEEGNLYEKSAFSGQWQRKQGFFGPERDRDWLGRPNIQKDWLGRNDPAQSTWGGQEHSADNNPLYETASSGGGSYGYSGGGSSAGDALAGFAGILFLILAVAAVGAVFYIAYKLLELLYNAYQDLNRRFPRIMLTIKLMIGMLLVGSSLWLAGFNTQTQFASAAIVPGLWAWLWLTRHLPMVFMPINAALAGAALWLVAMSTQHLWQEDWHHLTAGIPLMGNLLLVLAVLPMVVWLWDLGRKRWPAIFRPLARLITGAVLWFVLMRVWPNWLPQWAAWVEPVPILFSLTGWLILLLPLVGWLWLNGQVRWPMPFTALNLLIFGGMIGLTAFHTEPSWEDIWRHWMSGLPFLTAPILTISLSPVTLWGWSWASQRWQRVLVIPNRLLTGGILWLILDRTRDLWSDAWQVLWGPVPLEIDPALLLLALPLAIWAWRRGRDAWPRYWGIARALLWATILWWTVERTRPFWAEAWLSMTGGNLNPALLAVITPPGIWIHAQLRRRWPQLSAALTATVLGVGLFWIASLIFPTMPVYYLLGLASLPLAVFGWRYLTQRHPRLGWTVALFVIAIAVGFTWLNLENLKDTLIPITGITPQEDNPAQVPLPTPKLKLVPTHTATHELSSPTQETTTSRCRSWQTISLDDVGQTLCVQGTIATAYKNEEASFIVFGRGPEDFYLLSYDHDLSGWRGGECVRHEGTVQQLGLNPVMVIGYNQTLKACDL